MLWLALTWLALIALWGASESWDLAGVRDRLVDLLRHRERADRRPGLH